jgi:dihydropteroate synthase
MAAGIEPWRLILDPGLGFSKTGEHNLELIGGLPRLRAALPPPLRHLPLLLGPSRKSFLGQITGVCLGGEERRDEPFWSERVCAVHTRRGYVGALAENDIRHIGGLLFKFPAAHIIIHWPHSIPRVGRARPEDRDAATAAAAALCVFNGADIIRAHNAAAVHDAVRVADAVAMQADSAAWTAFSA